MAEARAAALRAARLAPSRKPVYAVAMSAQTTPSWNVQAATQPSPARSWKMRATPELTAALRSVQDHRQQTGAMHAARTAGWTLDAIGEVLGITREGVRQRLQRNPDAAAPAGFTVPGPPNPPAPPAPPKRRRLSVPPDMQDRLRELQAQATRVNGATPEGHPDRVASVELSALLAGLERQRVSVYRLARILGVTERAVKSRLERHGYKEQAPSAREAAYLGRTTKGTTKDQCKWGHPMTPGHPNVRLLTTRGERRCRECERRRAAEYQARR